MSISLTQPLELVGKLDDTMGRKSNKNSVETGWGELRGG